MIEFANAKINIGLQVLSKREDGYHNLETVFYPIPLYDIVEVIRADATRLVLSGQQIEGDIQDNLCMRAYELLRRDFDLAPVEIHLHKTIPTGAGLGGGSSDATAVLKALDKEFDLALEADDLERYASQLGADCAFFVRNTPVLARGRGDEFASIALDLQGYSMLLVKPDIYISTKEAYAGVSIDPAGRQLSEMISRPVEQWKELISNDFEKGIFKEYPALQGIKDTLYVLGAEYVAMSGSGSAIYALFRGASPSAADAELQKIPRVKFVHLPHVSIS